MDPCTIAMNDYKQYYETNQKTACSLDNYWKLDNRAQFCSECLTKYDSLLSAYVSACGENVDPSIKLNHDGVQFYKGYYCTQDNGVYCDQVAAQGFDYQKPYAQWDAQSCTSTCVSSIDAAIRSVAANNQIMSNHRINGSLFTGNDNPVSSCAGVGAPAAGTTGTTGNTGVTGANGVNGAIGTTNTTKIGANNKLNSADSGAYGLNPQISLITLIVCLLFALLK